MRAPTVLRFLNLFASAVLSGGLVMTVAALRPGLALIPMSAAVPAQQMVVRRATFYMPICGAVCALSAVFLVKRRFVTKESTRYYRIGLVCMIFTGLISIYVGGVLDAEIRNWRVYILADERTAHVTFPGMHAPGSRRARVWDTWDLLNDARTASSVLALAFFIVANLQPRVLASDS